MQTSNFRLVTLSELREIETPPPMGSRHVPVPHCQLVEGLMQACARNHLTVTGYDISVGGTKRDSGGNIQLRDVDCCGTLNLATLRSEEMGIQLGFWSSNVMRRAIHIVAGRNVFVCSNMVICGDAILVNRKHTSGFDIRAHLVAAVRQFITAQHSASKQITALQHHFPSVERTKNLLYDIWSQRIVPARVCRDAHDLFFETAPAAPDTVPDIAEHYDTAWGVYSAFTRALKPFPLHQKLRHTSAIDTPFRALLAE